MSDAPCAGLLLAGGQSSRMGDTEKALSPLGGKPMLAHVIECVAPQVGPLAISVASGQKGLDAFGLPLVSDTVPSHRGPMAGLVSGLEWASRQSGAGHLLLCPCDAPFVPPDLLKKLQQGLADSDQPLAVARYQGHLQPTFSVWSLELISEVQQAFNSGQGGLMRLVSGLSHLAVDWPEQQPPPFYNVNSPEQLQQAERWLDRGTAQH